MNTNSNTYTVIYSIILVVVVAAVLAFVSVSLSDRQNANVATETRQSILYSVNLAQEADQAKDKNSYIEAEYNKYITDSYLVNVKGDKVEGEAFPMALASGLKSQYDIMKQANPDVSKLTLPVFVCTLDDGSRVEIFPIYGAGLWGPIWGYISLKDDYNTVYGATFLHKGETPGLGAEIATPHFSNQFAGKTIFEGDNMVSISGRHLRRNHHQPRTGECHQTVAHGLRALFRKTAGRQSTGSGSRRFNNQYCGQS